MARQPFTFTAHQLQEFEETGALYLPGYFPAREAAALADLVWTDLKTRFSIDRKRPETWTVERPGKFQALMRSPAMGAFALPQIRAISGAFLADWPLPERGGGMPMVTFAAGHRWELPHQNWHLDTSASMSVGRLPCVRIFTFLEPSRPRGGGTCYLAGSHRLAIEAAAKAPGKHLHSPDVRAALKAEHPWFGALFAPGGGDRVERFMEEGVTIRGTEVKACEMTGDVGDVYLLHPATLHAIAVNELRTPRMMLMGALGQVGPNMGM